MWVWSGLPRQWDALGTFFVFLYFDASAALYMLVSLCLMSLYAIVGIKGKLMSNLTKIQR